MGLHQQHHRDEKPQQDDQALQDSRNAFGDGYYNRLCFQLKQTLKESEQTMFLSLYYNKNSSQLSVFSSRLNKYTSITIAL